MRGIKAERQATDADIYDLSGRKVSSPRQGVYIQSGQKLVVR